MTHRTALLSLAALLAVSALAGCGSAQELLDSGEPAATKTAPVEPSVTDPTTTAQNDLPEGFGAGPPGQGLDRFYEQQVTWEACNGGECASIWVPLDYGDPDGQAITLKAKRDPADDESSRRGSLFINPGGPGASGIDYLSFIGLDSSITDVYDVVGFDPRGVGESTPVDCLSDPNLDAYVASDPTPDDPAEIQGLEDDWSQFTAGCEELSGPLLGHVSTVEVARDINVMRAVVGDDKLNYFGASYGTYIGATYAALFPKNVDRMVLDGAVDPLAKPRTNFLNQSAGFDSILTSYIESCIAEGDCPLGDDVDGARDRLIQLFKDLDSDPLPTSSGRDVTEGLAFLGVIYPLYDSSFWSVETQSLRQAIEGGTGDLMLAISDTYTKRGPDGSYGNNGIEAQPAVNCLDHPESESLDQIEAGAQEFLKAAPVFGAAAQWWPYACSNWPVTASEPQPDFSAAGAAPIVVVGTTGDPATPYQQSVNLADELDSGVLLSRHGDDHTAYGHGNACIDDAINTYLVTGTPPADNTTC